MTSQQGRVKYYNKERGYGFISNGGSDVFFHFTAVAGGAKISEGDSVSFEARNGKPRASSVTLLDDENDPAVVFGQAVK
jgi:cold shock CspA family protein